jgi:hypothetical protein
MRCGSRSSRRCAARLLTARRPSPTGRPKCTRGTRPNSRREAEAGAVEAECDLLRRALPRIITSLFNLEMAHGIVATVEPDTRLAMLDPTGPSLPPWFAAVAEQCRAKADADRLETPVGVPVA